MILDLGMLPASQLLATLVNSDLNLNITLLTETRRKNEYREIGNKLKVLFYENFAKEKGRKLHSDVIKTYDLALKEILSDARTFWIAERVNRLHPWNSLFNLVPKIEKVIFNFLIFHQEHPVDEIFFQATPHNLTNWVIAKTSESVGIRVRFIQTSPLPWRYWIVEGLTSQRPVYPVENPVQPQDFLDVSSYIELNQRSYDNAIPEYEKKRLEVRKGNFWSWKQELKSVLKTPKSLMYLKSKRQAYTLYNKLAVAPQGNNLSVALFLHYQPERTSLPEGYHYANQWLIIKKISAILPLGCKLLVKEHPSMFTNTFDGRYRDVKFYKDIIQLSNVELVPLDFNTFDLIDLTNASVTITGTVGVQTLIRNKPVVVCGSASYRNLPNVYELDDMVVSNIQNLFNFSTTSYQDIFGNLLTRSISGLLKDRPHEDINFYSPDIRVRGHIEVIKTYLNSYA